MDYNIISSIMELEKIMQKIIDKLLRGFVMPKTKIQTDAINEYANAAKEIMKDAQERSALLGKKLHNLFCCARRYWDYYLEDRFAEGLLFGIIAALDIFGSSGTPGVYGCLKGISNPLGLYYRSDNEKKAEDLLRREQLAVKRKFKHEAETVDKLCICAENICRIYENYYWKEGLHAGNALGINAVFILDKLRE